MIFLGNELLLQPDVVFHNGISESNGRNFSSLVSPGAEKKTYFQFSLQGLDYSIGHFFDQVVLLRSFFALKNNRVVLLRSDPR